MVATCSAVDCTNRFSKEQYRSFFKFPLLNPELTKKWVTAMKRDKWAPTKSSYLCSDHFLEKNFRYNNDRRSLLPNVVPSVFTFSDKLKTKSNKKKKSKKIKKQTEEDEKATEEGGKVAQERADSSTVESSQSVRLLRSTRQSVRLLGTAVHLVKENIHCEVSNQPSNHIKAQESSSSLPPKKRKISEVPTESTADVVSEAAKKHAEVPSQDKVKLVQRISIEHMYSLPSPRKLKKMYDNRSDECQRLRRELHNARQNACRQREKCARLRQQTFTLRRKYYEKEALITENDFTGVLRDLLISHVRGYTNNACPTSVKEFSCIMRSFSSRAYDYLRKIIKLPHPRTIRHWAHQPEVTENNDKDLHEVHEESESFLGLSHKMKQEMKFQVA